MVILERQVEIREISDENKGIKARETLSYQTQSEIQAWEKTKRTQPTPATAWREDVSTRSHYLRRKDMAPEDQEFEV